MILIDKLNSLRTNFLNSKLNRDLRTLSHYKFKCKLEEKCKNRQRNLIVTTEEYTSKTCGKINDVGLKRVFTCEDVD